jgi:putative ABC transport system permease protein
MGSFGQDLLLGSRRLWSTRGFSLAAVSTLALGMGMSTIIFSVASAVLLAPLPWKDPASRVMVWSHWRGFDKTWVNPFELTAYAAQCPSLDKIAYWETDTLNVTGDGATFRLGVAKVSHGTFETLGSTPVLGRTFEPDEDRPEGPRVAVLSYRLWQGLYAGQPSVLGRLLRLDGSSYTIVGVMPAGFALPTDFGEDALEPSQVYIPRAADKDDFKPDNGHSDFGAALLRPGASPAQANREIAAVASGFVRTAGYPAAMNFTAFAVPLAEEIAGPYEAAILILSVAVGLVMWIACANVASLLLAKAGPRQREMAVRRSLGASGARIVRQLLAEGFILALLAGLASLVIASTGLSALRAAAILHIPQTVSLDQRTLAFAVGLSFVTTLLSSLAPAIHLVRTSPFETLKDANPRGLGGRARRRWQAGLVVLETSFAVLLAVGAGLMVRTLHNLGAVDLGFDPKGVLTMGVSLSPTTYDTHERVSAFYEAVLKDVRALPGVTRAGFLRSLPLAQTIGDRGIVIEGEPPPPGGLSADWQVASGGASEALGETLLAGRFLSDDDRADGPQVAVINRSMARRFFPGRDAMGRRFQMGGRERPMITIVGIVKNEHHNSLTGEVKPKVYRPETQFFKNASPRRAMNLVIRGTADPKTLLGEVRAVVSRVDPEVPLSSVRPMNDVVKAAIATPRLAGGLLLLFSILALTLAAVGLYGVLSYAVSERGAEIGVRMALGASRGRIMRLVLSEVAGLVGVGLAGGMVLSLGLTGLMRSLLEGVSPTDRVTYAGVALVLPIVAVLASCVPALRATRVEPAVALRGD